MALGAHVEDRRIHMDECIDAWQDTNKVGDIEVCLKAELGKLDERNREAKEQGRSQQRISKWDLRMLMNDGVTGRQVLGNLIEY